MKKQQGIIIAPFLVFLLTGAIIPAGAIAVLAKPAAAIVAGIVLAPAAVLLAEDESQAASSAVAEVSVPDEPTTLAEYHSNGG